MAPLGNWPVFLWLEVWTVGEHESGWPKHRFNLEVSNSGGREGSDWPSERLFSLLAGRGGS